jgi:5-methylcytosine-specific restriction endonuclease McrA
MGKPNLERCLSSSVYRRALRFQNDLIFMPWYNKPVSKQRAGNGIRQPGKLPAGGMGNTLQEVAMNQCVVLNADYSFLNVVDWKRAVCLLVKEKVKVLRYSAQTVKTGEGLMVKVPLVIKLINLIRTVYRSRVPFSRRNVLIRDKFLCAYCRIHSTRLTIDHIVPRSRGGHTTFENCVAACTACNHKKGNRTPSEADMYPRTKAYAPTISEFLRRKVQLLGLDNILTELTGWN